MSCFILMAERKRKSAKEEVTMKKKSFNWDKAFASVAAHADRTNAAVAKRRAKEEKGKAPKPAPKAQPTTDLDMSELQKRLRF